VRLGRGFHAVQGIILFNVGGKEWTLDLSSGKGAVTEGQPDGVTPELTLTMTDETFAKLVAGKLNPQQVRLVQQRHCAFGSCLQPQTG
jgi:putative sterol carrier protein